MKDILIILDGFMEECLEGHSFKKLLFGDMKLNYDERKEDFSVEGKDLDSLNCIFKMLGYDSSKVDIGERAFYEALNRGIKIKDEEGIYRCNIIKVNNGILEDFTGGDLDKNIGEVLKEFKIEGGYLYPCYQYKNLLLLNEIIHEKLNPPHFSVGKKIEEIMPKNKRLRNIINYSYEFFKDRSLEGLMLWPWGASGEVKLKKYNKESVLIGGIDLICGMGKALGMIVVQPKGATGEWDSALHNKLEGVLEWLPKANNIILHVNGFDELSHRKDFKGKMQFLEKVKNELLFPLLNLKGVNIRITCDHRTDSFTGSHEKGYVPYLSIFN